MTLATFFNFFIKISVKKHLLIAFIIRLLLIIYGEYHDRTSEVPYTDIDYRVFTDAARHVWKGGSPFQRQTFRYSPLMAILLIPNIIFFYTFGKILFSLVDLVVGLTLKTIVKNALREAHIATCKKCFVTQCEDNEIIKFNSNLSMLFWLYNPLTIAIATRGNADSIAALCVLLTIYLLTCKKSYFLSGLMHGLASHLRIYPIIFSLSMFMHLSDYCVDYYSEKPSSKNFMISQSLVSSDRNKSIDQIRSTKEMPPKRTIFQKKYLLYLIPNYNQISLILGTIISLFSLIGLFYWLYGYEFLYETYIYHMIRKDPRHNFSIYFYLQYLVADIKNIGIWHKVLTILPSLILLLVISIRYGLHKQSLVFSMFAQAVILVTFNSVITSQYFIWFLSLLPMLFWQLELPLWKWAELGVIWMVGQLAWLLPAFLLEFRGHNAFFFIWIQSVAFFSANIIILSRFIQHFSPVIIVTNKKLEKLE